MQQGIVLPHSSLPPLSLLPFHALIPCTAESWAHSSSCPDPCRLLGTLCTTLFFLSRSSLLPLGFASASPTLAPHFVLSRCSLCPLSLLASPHSTRALSLFFPPPDDAPLSDSPASSSFAPLSLSFTSTRRIFNSVIANRGEFLDRVPSHLLRCRSELLPRYSLAPPLLLLHSSLAPHWSWFW